MESSIKTISKTLGGLTMYQIVLYSLVLVVVAALITSLLGVLGYSATSLLGSISLILLVGFGCHKLLSKLFSSTASRESWLITALLLFLILKPAQTKADYATLVLGTLLAMVSKYLLTFRKHHILNPVAIALVVLGLLGSGDVYWWVGSAYLLPIVAVVGFVILIKLQLMSMALLFLLTALASYLVSRGISAETFKTAIISGPLVFFAVFMLTEPLTAPRTYKLRSLYAVLVGLLYGLPFSVGALRSSPELALVLGNIFAFFVNSKHYAVLTYNCFTPQGSDIYEFSFKPSKPFNFKPGQYLQWTLPHTNTDLRGDRRYFTIASSPTEPDVKLVIKIDQKHSSSFKRALLVLKPGNEIWVSQLSGEFTLPKNEKIKLVFIAGGVGITPFRSMIQYLSDSHQTRDITLYYASQTADGFSYTQLFKSAGNVGIKVLRTITGHEIPPEWAGRTGRVSITDIQADVADYKQAHYYLSGPNSMVAGYKKQLIKSGVRKGNIKVDYFPGF